MRLRSKGFWIALVLGAAVFSTAAFYGTSGLGARDGFGRPADTSLPQALSNGMLLAKVKNLETECKCTIGFAAGLVEKPEEILASTENSFGTASVYKVAIAAAFLNLVDQGKFSLDQKVEVLPGDILPGVSEIAERMPHGGPATPRELVSGMVITSDNSASDAILRLAGGGEKVSAYLASKGLGDFHVVLPERLAQDRPNFEKNSVTPRTAVQFLDKLFRGELLSKGSTEFLIARMVEVKTGTARIKGLLPAGTVVAHKTGSSGTVGGLTWATNDIGVITLPNGKHLAVAVFVKDSRMDGPANELMIAKAALAAYQEYVK